MAGPSIIKQGTILHAETYSTTPFVMGSFDANELGDNNALLLIVPYSRLSANVDRISTVTFDGQSCVEVGHYSSSFNSSSQPRVAVYILTNPNKVVGDIAVTFTTDLTDATSTVSVHPILLANVRQLDPVGYVTGSFVPLENTEINDIVFNVPIELESNNSLVFGVYHGLTAVRNAFTVSGNVTQYHAQTLDYATSPDKAYWIGNLPITQYGYTTFDFAQTTYPDTQSNIFFEIKSADVLPVLKTPYSASVGESYTVTFEDIVTPPTEVIFSSGSLSQTLTITESVGVYTLTMPTLLNNAVLFGQNTVSFVDGSNTITSVVNYGAGSLSYVNITQAVDVNKYPGWTIPPQVTDQLVFDPLTTEVLTDGSIGFYDGAGTETLYHINSTTGDTTSFTVTFTDPIVRSIDLQLSTSTFATEQVATITFTSGSYEPIEITLHDQNSELSVSQFPFTWNSTLNTVQFTVDGTGFTDGDAVTLAVYLSNGALLSFSGSLTITNSIVVITITGWTVQTASPLLDGRYFNTIRP